MRERPVPKTIVGHLLRRLGGQKTWPDLPIRAMNFVAPDNPVDMAMGAVTAPRLPITRIIRKMLDPLEGAGEAFVGAPFRRGVVSVGRIAPKVAKEIGIPPRAVSAHEMAHVRTMRDVPTLFRGYRMGGRGENFGVAPVVQHTARLLSGGKQKIVPGGGWIPPDSPQRVLIAEALASMREMPYAPKGALGNMAGYGRKNLPLLLAMEQAGGHGGREAALYQFGKDPRAFIETLMSQSKIPGKVRNQIRNVAARMLRSRQP